MSYLGIFEWVFSRVLENIITPVFDFVASIISYGLGWVFENLLGPIMLPILQTVYEWMYKLIIHIYAIVYFSMFQLILSFIDYMERAFDIFIGLEPVTYKGESGTLLEVLLKIDVIQNAFYLIMFSGILIAMLLTIYGVARSAFDLDFENKRPVSHVLGQMFKSFIGALLIPFMVWTLVYISTGILTTLDSAVTMGSKGEKSTLGSTLFVIASTHAAWNPKYNLSTTKRSINFREGEIKIEEIRNEKFDLLAPPREKFYYNDTFDNYKNIAKVMVHFDLGSFDYEIVCAAIVMLIIMFMCLLTFIRRLFEILLLYLASPYFVAMIPLDDGAKFKNWLGMFVGRLVTGYGSVVVMKLYLMLCPVFAKGNIVAEGTGPEMQYIMKGIFILGGGWAVFKSGNLLTEIVNQSSARAEQASMRAGSGFLKTAADIAMTPAKTAVELGEQVAIDRIRDRLGKGGGGGGGGQGGLGGAFRGSPQGKARGVGGSAIKRHVPPNKPLPPIPGSKLKPPNRPAPQPPGSRRVPPNRPAPQPPGSRRVPPNRPAPLPPRPNRPAPLPPRPDRPAPQPPNKPIPPTPPHQTLHQGSQMDQGVGSGLRERLVQSRSVETVNRPAPENRAPSIAGTRISSSYNQANTFHSSDMGSSSSGHSGGIKSAAELAREKSQSHKGSSGAGTKGKYGGGEDKQ